MKQKHSHIYNYVRLTLPIVNTQWRTPTRELVIKFNIYNILQVYRLHTNCRLGSLFLTFNNLLCVCCNCYCL